MPQSVLTRKVLLRIRNVLTEKLCVMKSMGTSKNLVQWLVVFENQGWWLFRDVYLLFFYDTIQYRYWQNDTDTIRYDTKSLKNLIFSFRSFGILSIQYNSIQGPSFSKWCKNKKQNMHLIKKNLSFLCQTSSILINIIIKSIVKSIVYLSFRYNTGISFMIPIWYDTFDKVHIPMVLGWWWLSCQVWYINILNHKFLHR